MLVVLICIEIVSYFDMNVEFWLGFEKTLIFRGFVVFLVVVWWNLWCVEMAESVDFTRLVRY